jgi:Glycosyl hydrolase family 26
MKPTFPSILTTFLAILAAALPGHSQEATPIPANDNKTAPYMAVYRWDISGLEKGLHDAYAPWLGRTSVWPLSFMPTEAWEKMQGEGWQLGPWSKWIEEHPGNRFILSVPLLPGSWDGSGPKSGTEAGVPVSIEDGAQGAYNEHFQKLAENLVQYGLGNTILRLGWEFNGGWYTWRAGGKEKAFAEYWREIVKTMRAVPGAEKLQFCWNPSNNIWFKVNDAYPGGEYVDYIGLDVYDQSWAKDTYPFPEGSSPESILERQKRAWSDMISNKQQGGVTFWLHYAKKQGKPFAIPEWGVCNRKDGHGGLDNPYFVEQMHGIITDPANNVAFHCYFDVEAGDGHHQLSPGIDHHVTEFPQSAAKFKELFGLK